MNIGDKYIITQHAVDHACIREDIQAGDEMQIISFNSDAEMYLGVCHETGVEEIFGQDDVDEGYLKPTILSAQLPKEYCSGEAIQEYLTPLTHHMEDSGEYEEYTGGSVDYYKVIVINPTTAETGYQAECNDIIEALGMDYAEGNAFKAIWRKAAARNLGKRKKGYDNGLYDAEKVKFFGERMVEMVKSK